jgi:peroxiredoxin
MRADIVPGAVFPDYELTDHAAKHRKLSDLQGPDPMILVLSRGGFCPKDRRQSEGLVQLHHEMEVGYCRLVTISTDNLIATNGTAPASEHIGPFCPTRDASCRRIWISLNTRIRRTTP